MRQPAEVARPFAELGPPQAEGEVAQSCEGQALPPTPDEVVRTSEQQGHQRSQDEVTQAEEQLTPRVQVEQVPWAREQELSPAFQASTEDQMAVAEVTTSREQRRRRIAQVVVHRSGPGPGRAEALWAGGPCG